MRALFLAITFLAAAGAGRSDAADQPDVAAHIAITAPTEGEWTVAYTLQAPAAELVFVRSPDNSRGEDWTAPDGFKNNGQGFPGSYPDQYTWEIDINRAGILAGPA